jgi:aspartate--ammonia ligase
MTLHTPKAYNHPLDIRETEIAIKFIKDHFEHRLAKALNLTRVSAPLFVRKNTGLNDDLNGVERPVAFDVKSLNSETVEVVHSLAKWKRLALKRYGFMPGEGLYTDMNAIRRDEDADNLHSIYVDQWDWEKNIRLEDRNYHTLADTVRSIYKVIRDLEKDVFKEYPQFHPILPDNITFISTQELEDKYPKLSPKEREDEIVKEKKAVFIFQIGDLLKSGIKHDGRAPDYDDWTLNGDIVVYNPVLDRAFELSSMGIRVDEVALEAKLQKEL